MKLLLTIIALTICVQNAFLHSADAPGKVVLVTGASQGIGLATCQLLAEKGYTVYGMVRKFDDSLLKSNPNIHFDMADVRSKKSVNRLIKHIMQNEGRIDVLVNNAAFALGGPLEMMKVSEIKEQFNTNLYGPIRLCHEVLPHMRHQKSGHIINISSNAGIWSLPYASAYSATKAALESISEALSYEVRPFNIAVSIVEPGPTKTNFETELGSRELDDAPYRLAIRALNEFKERRKKDPSATVAAQTAQEVAEAIVAVIEDPAPKLRYQTGPVVSGMIDFKLKDTDGTGYSDYVTNLYKQLGL